jgi:hypothetical protein
LLSRRLELFEINLLPQMLQSCSKPFPRRTELSAQPPHWRPHSAIKSACFIFCSAT